MSVVVAISVTWVTLAVLVLGACIAAGRADRAAEADELASRASATPWGGIPESAAPSTGAFPRRARRSGAFAPGHGAGSPPGETVRESIHL
ncbi:MAG: hypothetical protein AAGC46_02380 [Solirubrobacteraceae bacterium]|nr:hypothetical protein [Patulibacter sp.]